MKNNIYAVTMRALALTFLTNFSIASFTLIGPSANAASECISNVSQVETASTEMKRAYEVFFKPPASGLVNTSKSSFIRLKPSKGTQHVAAGQILLQYLSTAFFSNELERKQGPIQVCVRDDKSIQIESLKKEELDVNLELKIDAPKRGCFLVLSYSIASEDKRSFCPGEVPPVVTRAIAARSIDVSSIDLDRPDDTDSLEKKE